MQIVKPIILGLLLMTSNSFAQSPKDINFYLKNNQISATAKDFYNGKFKATDNKKTFSILDSLKTRNNETRPFYIFLISKMMDNSDGALSEELGNTVKEFLEKNPNNVIDFLYSDNTMVSKSFKNNWAKAIKGEFMIICENGENACITMSLRKSLVKTKATNKTKLTNFYRLIERYNR